MIFTKQTFTKHAARKRILILSLLLLLLAAGLWLYYLAGIEQDRGNDRFGLAFINSVEHPADELRYEGALAAGARWDRWPIYWNWVAQGGYTGLHDGDQPHDYDRLVIQEIEHGLRPLLILMGTPQDQARPVEQIVTPAVDLEELPLRTNPLDVSAATLPPRNLDAPIFLDGTDEPGPGKQINPDNPWAEFVFTTVDRYRPGGLLAEQQGWGDGLGVRHWEVWNEPDFDLFWYGTAEEYYRLLEVAYKSIKTADPEAIVLLGGLAFYEKPSWLEQFLRQTGGDPARAYFDVFSMHHYWSVYNSEDRLKEARVLLNAFNLSHIPVWITESGLSVWDDYPATSHNVSPDTPWRGTTAEQAAYIIQHSALALYHGAERYFHFMLHDDCGDGPSSAYGLRHNFSPHRCNPAQGQPRPAYAAYQLAAEQFKDLAPLWRRRTPNFDQVAFYRPHDRARLLVVWATQGMTTTTAISATGEIAQLYWIETGSLAPEAAPEEDRRRSVRRIPVDGSYILELPPATNTNSSFPNDIVRHHIGGQPYLLIEQDTLPPASTMTPLPPTRPSTFVVAWQGEDLGSGIAGYDLWVGQDDGPLEPWLTGVTATEAAYTGQIGHTYRFAVRARDYAGNEEPAPAEAQTSTLVAPAPAVTGVLLGPNRELIPDATVTIEGLSTRLSLTTTQEGTWSPVPLLPGDYTLQAAAPGYGHWPAPRRVQLDDSAASLLLTLAPPENAVIAGDFEGNQVWSHWDWAGQVDLFFQAFDGQFAARLGQGQGEPAACPETNQPGQRWSIQQQVAIPAAGQPRLSFVHRIFTPQPAAAAWLELNLIAPDQAHPLIPPGDLSQPSDWTLASLDLTPWRGQTVQLQFQVTRCSDQPFTITLDRVSVGDSRPQDQN